MLTTLETVRETVDAGFLARYLLVVVGVLVASVSVEVWASSVELFYRGDVSYRLFTRRIAPWGVLTAVGIFLALSGGTALVRKAASEGVRDARNE
ncbi:hypothetical protein ACFQJD_15775 [Haloplanus sp. GCM10025708]|uniref:hypothetical protein n=1 Tax=Haloferacaceae TaxID=1644056 RepID=UPI003621CCCE